MGNAPSPRLPARAQVVVVGGGVIGCSVAYHLAHLGWIDVVVLERDKLTSGTTWHAAGLVVTFGSTSSTSTELRRYTRDLSGADVAVMGVPFDLSVSSRSGTRLGPRAVRSGSSHIAWSKPWPWEADPYEALRVVDYGDCEFDYGYPHQVPGQIAPRLGNRRG